MKLVGPFGEKNSYGILYAHIPKEERTAKTLKKSGVHVNLGHEKARIATHYFNTEEDVDRLVEALK